MASRHNIPPSLALSDFGVDTQALPRQFQSPASVTFAAGANVGDFVAKILKCTRARIEAAAGAGKSVRLPPALSGSVKLLVHCVPSRHLAASLYDYVTTVNPAITYHFIDDVVDEYPESGVVLTYSAAFVSQAMRWRVRGFDPKLTLYLDECHESDGATATLRGLQTDVHGVSRYLEASATFGTGDISSSFSNSRLPSKVEVRHHDLPDPDDLDLDMEGQPWSMGRLDGHLLYFIDDPEKAYNLRDRYAARNYYAVRLDARMSVSEMRTVFKALDGDRKDERCVLIADYTFRSGFTFKTVSRIIDYCEVTYYTISAGRTLRASRPAYNAETYQAKNRGGRIAGLPGVYITKCLNPKNNMVLLEGVEVDLSAIYRRALGFRGDPRIGNNPFVTGKVPKCLVQAMRGVECLRCYIASEDWPNSDLSPPSPSTVQGIELKSDTNSVSDESDVSDSDDGADSVFSIATNDHGEGSIDAGKFENMRRASKARKAVDHSRDAQRVPPLPDGAADWAGVFSNLHAGATKKKKKLPLTFDRGKFYVLVSEDDDLGRNICFPDGVVGIINAAKILGVPQYISGLPAATKAEAVRVALDAFNDASAQYNASESVLQTVKANGKILDLVELQPFTSWLCVMRDQYTGAIATMTLAEQILNCIGRENFSEQEEVYHKDKEKAVVHSNMIVLDSCMKTGMIDLPKDGGTADQMAAHQFVGDRLKVYPELHGRFMFRLTGDSLRTRVARALLGSTVHADGVGI